MPERKKVEVFVSINEDGDYYVGTDASEASEGLTENVGGEMCRTVKLTLSITPPAITEVAVDVPDEAGSTVQVEAVE